MLRASLAPATSPRPREAPSAPGQGPEYRGRPAGRGRRLGPAQKAGSQDESHGEARLQERCAGEGDAAPARALGPQHPSKSPLVAEKGGSLALPPPPP